eukprot:scaffold1883_cov396-Prasinococcus_capsulatus_cf.AAC.17
MPHRSRSRSRRRLARQCRGPREAGRVRRSPPPTGRDVTRGNGGNGRAHSTCTGTGCTCLAVPSRPVPYLARAARPTQQQYSSPATVVAIVRVLMIWFPHQP